MAFSSVAEWVRRSSWRLAVCTAFACIASTWLLAWAIGRFLLEVHLSLDAAVVLTEATKACGAFASSVTSALILKRYDTEMAAERAREGITRRMGELVLSVQATELLALGSDIHVVTESSLTANLKKVERFAECVAALKVMAEDLRNAGRPFEVHPRFVKFKGWGGLQRLAIATNAYSAAQIKTKTHAADVVAALLVLSGDK